VHDVLRSPGEPLRGRSAQHAADPRLSDVRVHADAAARASAASVGAAAYTVGEHVVLGNTGHAPGDASTQMLLRHELAHTLQQPRIGRSPPAHIPVGAPDAAQERDASDARADVPLAPRMHDPRPVLRRATITRTCETFRGACPADSQQEADSREAVERMNATRAGQWLLQQLDTPALRNVAVDAHFADNIVSREAGVMGQFRPDQAGASSYAIDIDMNAHQAHGTATAAAPTSPLPRPSQPAYGGQGAEVQTYVAERPSLLAETLFHELLHIWFVNNFGDLSIADPQSSPFSINGHATGHLDAAQGEIDPRFLRRLREFSVQIYRVETDADRIRRAAAAHAPPPPTSPHTLLEPPDVSAPRAGRPAPVTFTAGVRVGLGGAPLARSPFDVPLEAHAGVLFGRAVQFGLRGEAVWFPGHGLVGLGGAASVNFLQTEDAPGGGSRIATNPWFFDLDAGAAYLIGAPDPLLLRAGVGVGQERGGPSDWRVFWRIGAALEANRGAMWNFGGEGNFTVGVRR
jgi:hypothetical protein